ncbi:MAG: hypothetical protein HZC40_04775 [Chloroflexi bacterium]|nr:hypothetical protein [Chloroflexota bacterium]
MGITIHYHGKLDDARVLPELLIAARHFCFQRDWEYDEIDDRVLGKVERWTTTEVKNEELSNELVECTDAFVETTLHPLDDVQRGILIQTHPESEPVWLLFNQAGELCFYMPTADPNQYWENKFLFTKTQFAPIENHIAICEFLHLIQDRCFPSMQVSDEGEYYETRDRARLESRFGLLNAIMDRVESALSDENADDPLADVIRDAADDVDENPDEPREKKKLNFERGAKIEIHDPLWHRARDDSSANKN